MRFHKAIAAFGNLLAGVSAIPAAHGVALSTVQTVNHAADSGVGMIPSNSFIHNCHGLAYLSPQYPPEVWYQVTCPDNNDEMQDTIINLNRCIANFNGTMVASSNGEFGRTCQNNYFKLTDTQILIVKCDSHEGVKKSYLRLEQVLVNDDGQLRCFNNRGCTVLTHDCLDEPPWPFLVPPGKAGYW